MTISVGGSPWPYSLAHDLRKSKPLKAFTPYTDRVADRSSVSAREIQEVLARIDHETPGVPDPSLTHDLYFRFADAAETHRVFASAGFIASATKHRARSSWRHSTLEQ